MNIPNILELLVGILFVCLCFGLLWTLPEAPADDIVFYLFGAIFSGIGGICFIVDAIKDWK